MRKLIYLFSLLAIFTSCQKENNEFSCNDDVNEWVTKYKSDISALSRYQITKLPISYQRAILRSLSPMRKAELWQEKLTILLESNSYNSDYRNKIIDLLSFVKEENYNYKYGEKPNEEVQQFSEEWEKDVLLNYEHDTLLYEIQFCSLYTLEEFDYYSKNHDKIDYNWLNGGDEIKRLNSKSTRGPGGGSSGGSECACSYSISCGLFTDCEEELNNCTSANDCGLLGSSKCDGMCDNAANVQPDEVR